MLSNIFATFVATAAVVSAAECPSCCNQKSLFMCNELGGIGGAHGAVCCANGQWGCPRAGAAGPSGCPSGVGYSTNCGASRPSTSSFMIAKFEDAGTYPHKVLLASSTSEGVKVDGDMYTPFVWKSNKLVNAYDANRCLGYDSYSNAVQIVACKDGAIWETAELSPKESWTRAGKVPVVTITTGKGAAKKCVELVGDVPQVVKCVGGKASQKWFLWNP